MQLILASASPQRKTLLAGLGLSFAVIPSAVDEDGHDIRDPSERATSLACLKAKDVHRKHRDAHVIGCDTLVVASDGTLLEKPKDAADAERMLTLQSGRVSTVHSGLCVCCPDGACMEGLSSSTVKFRTLSDADRSWWIATGQWRDRSGAFQIDGLGQLMIERIEGDWTGVVGLPVYLLGELLRKAGVEITG